MFLTKRELNLSIGCAFVANVLSSRNFSFRQTPYQTEVIREEETYQFTPAQRFAWYHNSFLPVFQIQIRGTTEECTLKLCFTLVRSVKCFLLVFLAVAAIFQIAVLVMMAANGEIEIIPMLLPALLCVFGSLLSFLFINLNATAITKETAELITQSGPGDGSMVHIHK